MTLEDTNFTISLVSSEQLVELRARGHGEKWVKLSGQVASLDGLLSHLRTALGAAGPWEQWSQAVGGFADWLTEADPRCVLVVWRGFDRLFAGRPSEFLRCIEFLLQCSVKALHRGRERSIPFRVALVRDLAGPAGEAASSGGDVKSVPAEVWNVENSLEDDLPCCSFVARESLPSVEERLTARGFSAYSLDTKGVHDRATFIHALATALKPAEPSDFQSTPPAEQWGDNLDSASDYLWQILKAQPSPRVALLWHHYVGLDVELLCHALEFVLDVVQVVDDPNNDLVGNPRVKLRPILVGD